MPRQPQLIDQYADLAPEFFTRVLELDFNNCLIDDETSLFDFHAEISWEKYARKVREVYGADVTDIPSGNLLKIFAKAFPERRKSILKREVIHIANAMLGSELEMFEGSRRLSGLHNKLVALGDEHDSDFNVFLCVWSDEDQFAFGAERDQWEPSALAELDKKQTEFENFYRKDIAASCRKLIAKFSEQYA